MKERLCPTQGVARQAFPTLRNIGEGNQRPVREDRRRRVKWVETRASVERVESQVNRDESRERVETRDSGDLRRES